MFARVLLLLLLLLLFGPVIPPQKQNSQVDISKKNISSAIGLSREGLLGKACQALVSPGVAPNTPEVCDLLRQKHPRGPHPSLPISSSPPVNHVCVGVRCGSSALFAEARKHNANDSKCAELGWVCIPLAVESYGCWGTEAQQSFSRLAARLAIQMGCSKSQATTIVYQRLSLSLMRANARALLSRARLWKSEEGG